MKYQLKVSSRAIPAEEIASKHEKFVKRITQLGNDWGFRRENLPVAPDPGRELLAIRVLSKHLGTGIKGDVTYQFRHDFPKDAAKYDDRIDLKFNPKKVDYSLLVNDVFPAYVEAFDAYHACIRDADVFGTDDDGTMFENWREWETSVGARNGVYWFHPVQFFDAILCKRAFALTPNEVVKKVSGYVEKVYEWRNGIVIIAMGKIFTREDANAIDKMLKSLLPQSWESQLSQFAR